MFPKMDVVLTLHDEGVSCVPTVQSIRLAADHARNAGVEVEFVAYLDKPDRKTLAVVNNLGIKHRIVEYGDQGQVRNTAVSETFHPYVAFMDGDDLCSSNWLSKAAQILFENKNISIVNPEFYLFFGLASTLFRPLSIQSDVLNFDRLCSQNLIDALAMYRREVLIDIPFAKRDLESGYAYEDWQWYLSAIQKGLINTRADGTIICKRRRQTSQNSKARGARVTVSNIEALSYSARRQVELRNV